MGKRKQPVEVEEPAEDEDLEAEAGDSGGGESGEGESEDEDTSGTDSGSSDGEGDDDDDSLPDESADEEDGDVDEDGVPTTAKEIVVNFNFRSPEEIDFLGLRSLLGSYHDGGTYDVSGLVNAVLEQDHVGSVVKAAEGDDPIAVFTVLNTLTHKDQDWLKQTAEWLAAHCKDADAKRKLAAALAAPGTGLLLNERLINCPPKIAPPLMQFLFSEVAEAAAEKGPDGDEFKLKRYLVATRVFTDPERTTMGPPDMPGPSSSKQPAKKAKTSASQGQDPVLVYLRPEDEFLHAAAEWSFTFPVENRVVGKDDLAPLRMVMLVDAKAVAGVRRELDSVVGNMAAGHKA